MASSEQLRSNLSKIRPIRELRQLCHVEKGRIRFAGGVNFLRNESRTRNEHSWHRSGGADEPRISFPIPIVFLDSCTIFNCPDVGQETREKRMEGSVRTHARLLGLEHEYE